MSYQCVCIKCKVPFVSNDDADFDGVGYCGPCKLLNKEIAKRVDEQIAAKRANKPRVEIENPYAQMKKQNKSIIHLNSKSGWLS